MNILTGSCAYFHNYNLPESSCRLVLRAAERCTEEHVFDYCRVLVRLRQRIDTREMLSLHRTSAFKIEIQGKFLFKGKQIALQKRIPDDCIH